MYDIALTESYFPPQNNATICDITVGDLLRNVARDHPTNVAMVDVDGAGV